MMQAITQAVTEKAKVAIISVKEAENPASTTGPTSAMPKQVVQ